MLEINVILISFFLCLIINYILLKKNFLIDKKFFPHKSFVSKNLVPISGGLIFTISALSFLQFENNFSYVIFLIFFVGILSDLNTLKSPYKRFFLQISAVLALVFLNKIFISSIRIPFFDHLLTFELFKYFFVVFCLLILINGSNFIDGVNTLLIGYFLSVILIILILVNNYNLNFETQNLKIIFSVLLTLFVFNFFEKFFCGDGGSYAISLIVGYYLILLSNLDLIISPYFIACLLWYPAYECLFSMIRKKIKKYQITSPDNRHLHQLLFIFFTKKMKFNSWVISSLTGILINTYNLIIFYIALVNVSQTKILVTIIILNVIFYNSIYFILKNKIR
ncbi:hypothetical protein [Candidatus Pelagibacter sp. RS39]|uniref:hypothetical protein n=1 Tax=Candidatus Pelagibacter sp. RS39 TaxID=1977864 RepID=UPI000A14955D|nr:hypothetical protein [Candidatus Pelagibacter sp. RS39]ARJ47526.1 hypothetical protein B5L73_01665 [Candidatus Pelagibacter sp. RS39]